MTNDVLDEPGRINTLETLFGAHHARRFIGPAWPEDCFAFHGSMSRLPELLQKGPLANAENLASIYGGRLEVSAGDLQVPMDNFIAYQNSAKVDALKRAGFTIFFAEITSGVPGLDEWKEQLSREIGAAPEMVRFAAFASPPTKGLRVHYDISSVILLQVRGRKLIRVGPSSMPYPTVGYANGLPLRGANLVQFSDRDPPVAPEDLTEYVLEPGSAIFLPGGYWHTTHCLDDSFAISIGLAVPTMVELVLQGLRSCLVRSSEWRRPAFRAWGDPESRQFAVKRLRSLLLDLGRIAAELEPEQVFASHSKVDVPRKLKHLTPATRFLKNPELSVDLTESDGKSTRAVLKQGEDSVSMIANEHQALGLKWITDRRKSFSLSDLQSHVGGEDLDLRALVVALATTGALYQLPARVEERRSPDAGR